MTEADFQRQVVELLGILGWEHLHVRKSIGRRGGEAGWQTTTNLKGWPDILAWSPKQRRVIAAELKSEKGRVSPEQVAVLASLEAAGVETFVWRPADLPVIQSVLRRLDHPDERGAA